MKRRIKPSMQRLYQERLPAQPLLQSLLAHHSLPQVDIANNLEDAPMLRMALTFLIIAIVAALFGFGLIADFTFDAAKILFFIFLVLAVIGFIADAFRGRSVNPV